MKDIPIFTTEYGVASLIFKEIPYRQAAYVRIQDAQPGMLEELLTECVTFCRMVGAEHIYAAGHEGLEVYPLYTAVWEMRADAWVDRDKLENLFPVTEATISRWRSLMNERMKDVDNAATLTARDEKRILESGGAYFIHRSGELLGLGWLEEDCINAIASVKPGMGQHVAHTLMSVVEGTPLRLEVASTNEKAIRLYEKLGFLRTGEISRWYKIL